MNRSDLANTIADYSHTLTSKIVAVVGGTSAVSKTSFGEWVSDLMSFLMQWPNMEAIANLAIILLVIERSFICWSWLDRTIFPWVVRKFRNKDK